VKSLKPQILLNLDRGGHDHKNMNYRSKVLQRAAVWHVWRRGVTVRTKLPETAARRGPGLADRVERELTDSVQ